MRDDARQRVKHPGDERAADQSTPSASGLGAGRDLDREERIERERREEREDVIDRERGDDDRKDQVNPTMPGDEPTFRTEI